MAVTLTRARTRTHTQVIGQPHPNTYEELIKECEEMRDSLEDFEAWNSGSNITNACKVI